MRKLQVLGVGMIAALSLLAGGADARDPNKVRCRAIAEDGARIDVRYESDRREFRADFQVGEASRDFDERWQNATRDGRDAPQRYARNDVLRVIVSGEFVGWIVLDGNLRGSLRFEAGARPFPANFPPFPPGTETRVGELSCIGQRR